MAREGHETGSINVQKTLKSRSSYCDGWVPMYLRGVALLLARGPHIMQVHKKTVGGNKPLLPPALWSPSSATLGGPNVSRDGK